MIEGKIMGSMYGDTIRRGGSQIGKAQTLRFIAVRAKALGLAVPAAITDYKADSACDILAKKALVELLMGLNEQIKSHAIKPDDSVVPIFATDEDPTKRVYIDQLLGAIAELPDVAFIVKEVEERTQHMGNKPQYMPKPLQESKPEAQKSSAKSWRGISIFEADELDGTDEPSGSSIPEAKMIDSMLKIATPSFTSEQRQGISIFEADTLDGTLPASGMSIAEAEALEAPPAKPKPDSGFIFRDYFAQKLAQKSAGVAIGA
jgi:hypothetical protein